MQKRKSRPSWKREARRRWPSAVWIEGRGPFALVAHCRAISVSLWETKKEAEEEKRLLADRRCGGRCWPQQHEVVDLRAKKKPGVEAKYLTQYEASR